jgi:futalosine hydrolase
MKILLTVASEMEASHLKPKLEGINTPHHMKWLVSGVGMVPTAYALGKELSSTNYDIAINLGIAGSFDRLLKLGEVVFVVEDHLAEEGAENRERFEDIYALGLRHQDSQPFINGKLRSNYQATIKPEIKQVQGITVNRVHGEARSIAKIKERLGPQLESMEGAAFYFACLSENLQAVQFRSISNYVEPRNKSNWKITEAMDNLADYTAKFIQQLG